MFFNVLKILALLSLNLFVIAICFHSLFVNINYCSFACHNLNALLLNFLFSCSIVSNHSMKYFSIHSDHQKTAFPVYWLVYFEAMQSSEHFLYYADLYFAGVCDRRRAAIQSKNSI